MVVIYVTMNITFVCYRHIEYHRPSSARLLSDRPEAGISISGRESGLVRLFQMPGLRFSRVVILLPWLAVPWRRRRNALA